MTKKIIALAAAVGLFGMSSATLAQNTMAPGQQMQEKGSVKGTTGASGYAPGQQMQTNGSVKGTTGASGYAPGHATTGTSAGAKADVKAGGVKANTGVNADVKVK
jgi:hypothetical protein